MTTPFLTTLFPTLNIVPAVDLFSTRPTITTPGLINLLNILSCASVDPTMTTSSLTTQLSVLNLVPAVNLSHVIYAAPNEYWIPLTDIMDALGLDDATDLRNMLNHERFVNIPDIHNMQEMEDNMIVLGEDDKELLWDCNENDEYLNFEE